MPSISGRLEVNLTVSDPESSAAWYSELLGLDVLYDFAGEDGRLHYVALVEPESRLVLCLVGHQAFDPAIAVMGCRTLLSEQS